MLILSEEIQSVLDPQIANEAVLRRCVERLKEGSLTRDENPASHYCTYFFPYNVETKKVFMVHHKKSGLWISPGGHIDEGETLMQTLNREIHEELGIENKVKEKEGMQPFLLTITPIDDPVRACKEHLDIWYRIPVKEEELSVDMNEFYATRWVTIDEARNLTTNKPNLEALDKMEELFTKS